jgi:hypothetical protein
MIVTRSQHWVVFVALIGLVVGLHGIPLRAQEPDDFEIEEEQQPPPPQLEPEDIDEILKGEDAIFAGGGYSYDPGNRRDPFKSLLATRDRPLLRGPRPEGIPGLLIDEIDLTGIFLTVDGPVAQIQSTDSSKSFLLRPGDQLYDGDVVNISSNEVVFKQIVDDPTALKPFREVAKKLNPEQ